MALRGSDTTKPVHPRTRQWQDRTYTATLRVDPSTLERVRAHGRPGESDDEVLNRLMDQLAPSGTLDGRFDAE